MDGGGACAAVGIFAPLAFVVGAVLGFVCGLRLSGSGFVGYLKRQVIALLITGAIVCGVGGMAYATADHPPLIDGKNLALDIEVRLPAKDRSIEQLHS